VTKTDGTDYGTDRIHLDPFWSPHISPDSADGPARVFVQQQRERADPVRLRLVSANTPCGPGSSVLACAATRA